MAISKKTFFDTYENLIVGRDFVEYEDYYRQSRTRFWKCFQKIDALGLPERTTVLDIGGGIMAVLLQRLLGFDAAVGDVNERSREDVTALGLKFQIIDLFSDDPQSGALYDLVVLQEVIEHIPHPPYLVFERIKKILKEDGILFVTTPNGHRFRNIIYMLAGREILDKYRYPGPGEALGHQHEYTMSQMLWQAGRAGMDIISSEYYEDGFKGASIKARIARSLTAPVQVVPHLRNGIMMVMATNSARA
jgi:SAM-dependent methyltransferase